MVKFISYIGSNYNNNTVLAFADTKAEVPETTATLTIVGLSNPAGMGSVIYTNKMEVATVDSSGNIEWGE